MSAADLRVALRFFEGIVIQEVSVDLVIGKTLLAADDDRFGARYYEE